MTGIQKAKMEAGFFYVRRMQGEKGTGTSQKNYYNYF
jgi:hypothetical protein